MRIPTFYFLVAILFLSSCSKSQEQIQLETELQVLRDKIEQADTITSNETISLKSGANDNSSQLHFDESLLEGLYSTNTYEVALKWSELYDKLPEKFQNTIYTNSGVYQMEYGDLYGLSKGYYWDLCGEHSENEIGYTIPDEFGARGGMSAEQETIGYRAGMVYFYIKHQLLKCD